MEPSQRVVNRYLEANRVTRQLGTCGLCEREVKIPGGKLAHHGYERPGYGFIQGSCPGTGHEPFEVSPKTAEIGRDMYESQVKNLTQKLKELPTTDELWVRTHRSQTRDTVKKEELSEREWNNLLREAIRSTEYKLKESSRLLDHYSNKVRNWKPAEVKSVDEELRKRELKQEEARQKRMVRYNTNRAKLIDRIKKAFSKLERAEKGLKSEKNPKKIAKYLKEAAQAANAIYASMGTAIEKLQSNYPGYIERDEVIAKLELDDIFKHMGILDSGRYLKIRETRQLEDQAYRGNNPEQEYLKLGLDWWEPFWPGWRGKVYLPAGTTGRNYDRISWPK